MRIIRYFCVYSTIFLTICSISQAHAQDISVSAVYKVQFGGVSLGKFRFQSVIKNNNYTINSRTKLKLLGGMAMNWKMNIHSGGEITHAGPQPMTFGYSFRNKKKKAKKINVTFTQTPEGDLKVSPGLKARKGRVPVQQKHLKDVYDPLSALIKLTLTNGEPLDRKICSKTIRLFDGKERYDIAFKYKTVKMAAVGHKKVNRLKSYVCSLKYIPVAGHKLKDKNKKYMSGVKGIEVWFTPSKETELYIPHTIIVPTPFGTSTTIKMRSFRVQKHGEKPVQLIR